ncbi:SRPBCC family protein [Rubrivirga sp.]|uniref:SRPBCC family protein n=1 Tax=Rubrivirga sp. TaxID=1885344 RepID=UPI003B52C8E2
MIDAHARIERARHLSASPDHAWAFLEDVLRWGPLFPHVEAVEPYPAAGPTAFRWELEPLGPPGRKVRTVYACRYAADADARVLTWTPVEGVGTARFEGRCALAPAADGGTDGTLEMEATLEIPAPGFLRPVLAPLVHVEMARMVDTFLERLDDALGL